MKGYIDNNNDNKKFTNVCAYLLTFFFWFELQQAWTRNNSKLDYSFFFIYLFFFRIEVFDSDKLGKDKSLGKININSKDLDAGTPQWFPLKGVKSGEILLNSEFLAPGQSPSVYIGDSQHDPVGDDSAEPGRPGSKKSSNLGGLGGKKSGNLEDEDGPVLHVDLIKAKDLIKTDMIGKSDPYAVLKYGNQKDKTNVINNTQNPQWDHSTDFKKDPGESTSLL